MPGDVGDLSLIAALLEEFAPDLLVHAAAYKHIPLMEANALAAVQNNAILTWQLAKIAAERSVPQLLLISTDKAANPRSILGASKRVAEQAILRWGSHSTRCTAIRLVNVLGSSGSVVPLFLEQIRHGGPLTITHPDVTNPYGDGNASERIAEVLARVPLGHKLLLKRAVPLAAEASFAVPCDRK